MFLHIIVGYTLSLWAQPALFVQHIPIVEQHYILLILHWATTLYWTSPYKHGTLLYIVCHNEFQYEFSYTVYMGVYLYRDKHQDTEYKWICDMFDRVDRLLVLAHSGICCIP